MSDLEKMHAEKMKDPEFRECYYDMRPAMDISEAMLINRTRLNLSQKELSKLSGVYQSEISRYENMDGNPNLKTLKRIAKAMRMMVRIEFVPIPSENAPEQEVRKEFGEDPTE